ncbi:DegT/DnrJ/EryC1/StrS family aminotransferase [Enterococcus durans]|uniref:DegT/DnrJ/EryC1/StrS family aminotransferase n=1 Tax=Enterococcus durans TaxID=53345 RepID=UPI0011575B1B|nr:DegT/DnrJ/EryC1/StrS family aminotransferase [Enterococcus durans]
MKINALEINLEVDEKEEILTSSREVLDSKIEWTNASRVFELEKQICQSYGCKHAVMLSSGSTAIQAALIALGITSQDIRLLSSFNSTTNNY